MAKRGAEEQLQKDAVGSGSGSEDDERVRTEALPPVEGRPIRGIPKRKGLNQATFAPPAAAPSFSFGQSSATAPATSSFSIGSSGSTPAPFSFGVSSATTQAPAPASTPFSGFSFSKPAAPTPTPATEAPKPVAAPFSGFSFKPAASAPAPAPSTSNSEKPAAANPFGGFSFNAGSSNGTPTPAPAPAPVPSFGFGATPSTPATNGSTPKPVEAAPSKPSEPAPSLASPPPEKEVTYYTELRGLNTSLLNFLTTSLEKDQFIDLTVVLPALLDQYTAKLDEAAKKAGKPVESREKPAQNGLPQAPAPKPVAPLAPPAVASFTLLKPSTSSAPVSGGFVPTVAATSVSSPFTFGGFGAKPAPTSETKKPSAEMNKLVEDLAEGKEEVKSAPTPAPFSFGSASSEPTESSTDAPKQPPSLFSFSPSGPLHPTTPSSKTFVPSPNTTAPTPPPPSKLGKFGPGGSTPQLAFGGAKPATPSASGSGSGSSFSFGFGGAAAAKPSTTTAAPFSFGSSATGASSGFSFGSKPSVPAATPFGSQSAAAPFTGFSGFASSSTPTPAPEESNDSAETTETPGSPSRDLSQTAGAGEEDEETPFECRARLYKIVEGKYEVAGLGQWKIKKSTEGKRRFLMRVDGTGTLIMNMNLTPSLTVTLDKKSVKFVGVNLEGKPTPYMLMVKSPELASEVSAAIEKEIGELKSASS